MIRAAPGNAQTAAARPMSIHMLSRCYAVVTWALVASYLAWPSALQQWPFLMVTIGAAMPAVVLALRRAPADGRAPWWLILIALVFYNIGNVIWIRLAMAGGRATGDGSAADLFYAVGGVFVLGSAIALVRHRGRGDVGGVIDSVITAVALGGVLWTALLLPALNAQNVGAGRQASLFVLVLVISGTLGAMVRVSLSSASGRLFSLGVALTLAAYVASALTVDATGARPDWTNVVFLAAYAALCSAALHPSVAAVTRPGATPDDDLSRGRLTFLGVMLALTPLVGGGRALLGLPTDGVLIAVSSAALVPLVMVRIARLAGQRREAEQALHRLATRDALTGLPNRAASLEALDADLAASLGTDRSASLDADRIASFGAGRPAAEDLVVLFCDLDGFKPVNDRLGHAAGDELLIEVAARLRACVRDGDMVSRFGGDEFVLLCRGADAVDAVTARIAAMAERPFTAGGEQVLIGLSVGAAWARPGETADEVLGRADLAMYEAKKSKSVGALSLVLA
ncbi:GGDEF domain-containing protein [Actinoplanes sp. LDG1-06]|uniref:GGDEF domain-containing protein n=1 Tax=Paractinoplanes ovalisporus TaxID=2810368 RepID=A0ABS2AGC7_9ACTN|nr:GGDEF domain-containing protein [Actinoplanes ovalisporus]MBM2618304.1 GGDEF domain-containing protein [Actinoplanes ovalisporus]